MDPQANQAQQMPQLSFMDALTEFNTVGTARHCLQPMKLSDLTIGKAYSLMLLDLVPNMFGKSMRAQLKEGENLYGVFLPARFSAKISELAMAQINAYEGAKYLAYLGVLVNPNEKFNQEIVVLVDDPAKVEQYQRNDRM